MCFRIERLGGRSNVSSSLKRTGLLRREFVGLTALSAGLCLEGGQASPNNRGLGMINTLVGRAGGGSEDAAKSSGPV